MKTIIAIVSIFSLALVPCARADSFGSGVNAFDIEFVPIGEPGNAADTTGNPNPAGAVSYRYRISKFEISEQMIDKANAASGLGITHDGRGPDKPVTTVTWNEAARFVNWLNSSEGFPVAYKFPSEPGDPGYNTYQDIQLWTPSDAGYDPNNLYRNRRAKYFLPSAHEWYKAAFYDPANNLYYDYPTGSDSAPDGIDSVGDTDFEALYTEGYTVGGPVDIETAGITSPFGTVGQAGNVWEWEESDVDLVNDSPLSNRGIRGGDWVSIGGALHANYRLDNSPAFEIDTVGFRVVSVPEPSAAVLVMSAFAALCGLRRR